MQDSMHPDWSARFHALRCRRMSICSAPHACLRLASRRKRQIRPQALRACTSPSADERVAGELGTGATHLESDDVVLREEVISETQERAGAKAAHLEEACILNERACQ